MGHLTHYDALFVLAPLPRAERRQLAHALVCDSCRAVLREVLAAQTPTPSPEQPASRRSRPLDYSAMWTALEAKLAAEVPEITREREAAQRELEKLLRLRREHPTSPSTPPSAASLPSCAASRGVPRKPSALQERARVLFTQVHKLADSTSGPDIPPGAGS